MSFASVMASKAPSAWWRQGESSGTTMVDSSGNGRHGTYPTPPTFGAPGLIHDGDTDTANTYSNTATTYGQVPYDSAWMTGVFSLFVRFKAAGVTGSQTIANRFAGAGNDGWSLRLDDAILRLYVNDAFGTYPAIALGTITPGVEYSAGFSCDGAWSRVFLDGAYVASLNSALKGASAQILVGRSGYGEAFGGVIDEVAYWNANLPDADHADLHTAAIGAAAPPAALAATLSATTGLTANLRATMGLGATFAAQSSLTADLTFVGKSQLAASLAATATLAPDLRIIGAPIDLAATLAGESSLSANLRHIAIIDTSTRYANDGYGYDGTAAVYFEPPIAEPPAHIRRAKVQQVHQSMSAPNLVNGVPR